jgi:hypothetical protein
MIRVDVAVYTSSETSRSRGYQLVARSNGIDRDTAQQLARWSPSHASLVESSPRARCWSSFALENDRLVLARTFYGGPEYSGRGGLAVVTHMVVYSPFQLEGYHHNPMLLARVLSALGHLRLQPGYPDELPALTLPGGVACRSLLRPLDAASRDLIDQAQAAIRNHERVILLTGRGPEAIVESLLLRFPAAQRQHVSFTTGLKPSTQRNFSVHVVSRIDSRQRIKFDSFDLRVIEAQSPVSRR